MSQKKKKISVKMELFNSDIAAASARQSKKSDKSAEPSPVEVMTEGFMKLDGERLTIKYFEPAQFDMEKQMTSLSFEPDNPDIVTMTRSGLCTTSLVFESGKRYICAYSAFGANFELCVNTFSLSNTLTFESGGRIKLSYSIENGGETVSTVRMTVDVTPEE